MITNNEIGKTCLKLRDISKLPAIQRVGNEAADLIDRLSDELKTCNNQLCLYCGQYKTRHLGSCNGCRWNMESPESWIRRETR